MSKAKELLQAFEAVEPKTEAVADPIASLKPGAALEVDWDGPSTVQVDKIEGDKVHIKRVDKDGKPVRTASKDQDDVLVVTKKELKDMHRAGV